MNIVQVKQMIKAGYKSERPVCIMSSPGIGKSSAVYQTGEELEEEYNEDFGMIEVRAASSSPAELAAIKYVDGGVVQEAEQNWFPTDEKVKAGLCEPRGFIFCDEITGGLPATQSTLQRLFLDRKLGGLTMAKGWQAVAAGNRAKDKAAAGNLSRAFVNRCTVVSASPDPDVHVEWAIKEKLHPATIAFVRFRPDCLLDGEEPRRDENPAFCTPRSLHILSDMLKADVKMDEETQIEMVIGTIGDGYGSEFNGFLRIMNSLPDLDKIISDPEKYPVSDKTDVNYAVIGALINKADDKNLQAIMKYFVRFPVELTTVAVKDLQINNKSIFRLPEFRTWAKDHAQFAL